MAISDYLSTIPKGQRVGGATADAADVKSRKLAVATKVLVASLTNNHLYQKAHLSKLPECLVMKTTRWLGDFLGRGRAGLSLDLVRSNNDWLIRPSPYQAARAWEWIKKHAEEAAPSIVEANGYPSVEALEERLMSDVASHQSSSDINNQPA